MTDNGQDPKSENQKPPVTVRRRRSRAAKQGAPSLDTVVVERKAPEPQAPGLLGYTLVFIYKSFYLLGITLARHWLRYRRRLRRTLRRLGGGVRGVAAKLGRALVGVWKGFLHRLTLPFARIRTVRQQMQPVMERSRRDGKVPLRAYWRIVLTFFRMLYTILRTIINYGAPIAAAFFIYQYITVELQKPMGLLVEYNGETLGYVETEADFESAARILKDRYIADDAQALIASPSFRLTELPEEEEYTDADELANRMVYASSSEIELAYGLYIDNTFYGAVTNSSVILGELQDILDENTIGAEDEVVRFVKSLKVDDGLYPISSLVEEEELLEVIRSPETVEDYYTVEDGDSPSLVAEKTGIPLTTLEALNGDLSELMYTGEQILTQRAQPFLSVMNIYTTVYPREVDYPVDEIETEIYAQGYRHVEQEGIPGEEEVTAQISRVNGVEVSHVVLDTRQITAPIAEKVIVGTNIPRRNPTTTTSPTLPPGTDGSSNPVSSQGFLWPTVGGSMTTYAGHTGVDIARPYSTDIYASRPGTVVLSRVTYTGYGRYIMIDHGDGFVTLYAHCSALYVNVGDYVNQGQTIAAVGSTGNSTGNHLHFEVRYNGQIMNPRNYIG